eukprot:6813553-Alexandrium_andersonii.AAC.1
MQQGNVVRLPPLPVPFSEDSGIGVCRQAGVRGIGIRGGHRPVLLVLGAGALVLPLRHVSAAAEGWSRCARAWRC